MLAKIRVVLVKADSWPPGLMLKCVEPESYSHKDQHIVSVIPKPMTKPLAIQADKWLFLI
jgi:hypothetical protein